MSSSTNLPDQVVSAIQAGRKIDAIKLLRETQGIGLKEAKHAVDAYLLEHPSLQQAQPNSNGLVFIVLILVIGYLGYLILG